MGVQPAFLRGRLPKGGLGVDLALTEAPTVGSPGWQGRGGHRR